MTNVNTRAPRARKGAVSATCPLAESTRKVRAGIVNNFSLVVNYVTRIDFPCELRLRPPPLSPPPRFFLDLVNYVVCPPVRAPPLCPVIFFL